MNERPASLQQLARRVWRLFDAGQKRECTFALLVSIAAGCFTVAGVAGIAPFLATLADPTIVERSAALAWLRNALGSPSFEDFLVWLGVAFVGLLVLANAVNLLAMLAIGRFAQRIGARFHALLFEEYLRRDLRFHTRSNSDVLATHVVHDVTRTVGGVIQGGLTLDRECVRDLLHCSGGHRDQSGRRARRGSCCSVRAIPSYTRSYGGAWSAMAS